MAIGTIFQFGNEMVEIRIDKGICLFKTSGFGGSFVPIEGLRLDDKGIIKEFPDLGDIEKSERKKIAIQRFKEKLDSFRTEDEKMDYLIADLKRYGYKPLYLQK